MASLLISTYPNDKPDSFSKIQQKYFSEQLQQSDQVNLSYEQFRAICYDSHELGRLRERALRKSNLNLG